MNLVQKLFSLEGKTAIVTGANTGLGQGISVALAAAGAHVFGVARRSCAETLEKVNAVGGTFTEVIADLSDMSAIDKIIAEVSSKTERIDILVNNAGISGFSLFTDITEDMWDEMMDTNIKGMYLTSKEALPDMISEKDGAIVNISSIWGQVGASCEVHYSASKAAVIGLTKALAK